MRKVLGNNEITLLPTLGAGTLLRLSEELVKNFVVEFGPQIGSGQDILNGDTYFSVQVLNPDCNMPKDFTIGCQWE